MLSSSQICITQNKKEILSSSKIITSEVLSSQMLSPSEKKNVIIQPDYNIDVIIPLDDDGMMTPNVKENFNIQTDAKINVIIGPDDNCNVIVQSSNYTK
jgi:hypothetical protein